MSTDRIRELNDRCRQAWLRDVFITQGVQALGSAAVSAICEKVQKFNDFAPANDPYREHDFGAFDHDGTRIFWKIDYYDLTLSCGSEDPSDPTKTRRVLTILLADEY